MINFQKILKTCEQVKQIRLDNYHQMMENSCKNGDIEEAKGYASKIEQLHKIYWKSNK